MFGYFIYFIYLFFSIAETHLLWPSHGIDDVLPEKCLPGCVALAIRKTTLLYLILTTKQQLVIHDTVSSGGDQTEILTRLAVAQQMDSMLQKVKNQTTRYLINVLIAAVAEELNMPIPPKVAYVVDPGTNSYHHHHQSHTLFSTSESLWFGYIAKTNERSFSFPFFLTTIISDVSITHSRLQRDPTVLSTHRCCHGNEIYGVLTARIN